MSKCARKSTSPFARFLSLAPILLSAIASAQNATDRLLPISVDGKHGFISITGGIVYRTLLPKASLPPHYEEKVSPMCPVQCVTYVSGRSLGSKIQLVGMAIPFECRTALAGRGSTRDYSNRFRKGLEADWPWSPRPTLEGKGSWPTCIWKGVSRPKFPIKTQELRGWRECVRS